jgi:hypothetical protein
MRKGEAPTHHQARLFIKGNTISLTLPSPKGNVNSATLRDIIKKLKKGLMSGVNW